MKKPLACLLLFATLLLCGCGMQGKFASSFGKRKYTSGIYRDTPSGNKVFAGKEFGCCTPQIAKNKIPHSKDKKPGANIKAKNTAPRMEAKPVYVLSVKPGYAIKKLHYTGII